MNDLERDLRELLDSRAADARISDEPPRAVVVRARRRQLGTVVTATLVAAILVTGSLVGMRSLLRADPDDQRPAITPVLPDAPEGFRSVALPYLSLAYPNDWSLVALQPERTRDRLLQLANFELGPGFGACESGWTLPRAGIFLEVRLGALQDPLPEWPTALDAIPGGARPCGAEGVLGASWEANGTAYSATALFQSDAPQADVDLLERAFETLTFPREVPQTEELLGFANLVLDTADSPVGPVLLYAYVDLDDVVREEPSYWVGIAGPAGTHLSGASQVGRDVPSGDEGVTMILDAWGGVVWGDVSTAASSAELRTVEGRTYPASLLRLPESLGVSGHQAVLGVVEGRTSDRVTTLLYDPSGDVLNDFFPTGARVTIATGTDPEAGPWELYLEGTNEGTGLGFRAQKGGGGSGCCLRPLREDFQLNGSSTGDNQPSNVTALASQAVTQIVFEASSGERIDGELYPVPEPSLGIPQIGLVIVPSSVALDGQLVAYDANGDELAREDIGDYPEPRGPTNEIDVVWTRLRNARDAVQDYAARHQGSLSGLDRNVSLKLDPFVRWNDGPLADGEVSVRGAARAGGSELTGLSGWTVVLVSATVGPNGSVGSVYCIGVNIDEDGGGNFRYGTQDAATYAECRGGWPDLKP